MSAASPSVAPAAPAAQTASGASFRDFAIGAIAFFGANYARSQGVPLSDADAALIAGAAVGGATAVRKTIFPVIGSIFAGALSRLAQR
jgi:hypothetical protein